MKILTIAIVTLLIVTNIAFADANVSINIDTTGDVNLDTEVNTTGNVTVWIDGTNIGEEINNIGNYIIQNEPDWLSDKLGLTPESLVYYIQGAINWLLGKSGTPDEFKEIGSALESYFASDKDIWILANKINELEMRIRALELTMEDVAPKAFCEVKKQFLKEYNLTYVKCGKNSTVYVRTDPKKFGYDIIAYSTDTYCEENWKCTDWSECINGTRKRVCVDKNNCGTEKNKPPEEQACIIVSQVVESPQKIEAPTGALLAVSENSYYLLAVMFIIVLILTIVNINIYRKIGKLRRRAYPRK